MAANFFEQASVLENFQKQTISPYSYNGALRFASFQIALSVPDIEARTHALAYFLAEEKEYCDRCAEESSHLLIQAKAELEDVARRVQILHNAKRMADIYLNYQPCDHFEKLLAQIMTQIEAKPIAQLKQTYAKLKSAFFQLSEHPYACGV